MNVKFQISNFNPKTNLQYWRLALAAMSGYFLIGGFTYPDRQMYTEIKSELFRWSKNRRFIANIEPSLKDSPS
jgi:hypothetical protein